MAPGSRSNSRYRWKREESGMMSYPLKDIGVELVHDVPSFHQEEQPHSSEVFCQHECCVQQSHHCPRCLYKGITSSHQCTHHYIIPPMHPPLHHPTNAPITSSHQCTHHYIIPPKHPQDTLTLTYPNVSFLHKRLNAVLKYGGQWFMERATYG